MKKSLAEMEGYLINNTPFRAWLRPYIGYTIMLVGASYVFYEYIAVKKEEVTKAGRKATDSRKNLPYVQNGEFYKAQPDQVPLVPARPAIPGNQEYQKYIEELEAMNKLSSK